MITNDNDDFEDDDLEDSDDSDAKTPEELALEDEFEKVVEKAHAEIDAEIDEAKKHIAKAVKLAEDYGVPFQAGVSPLRNNYIPQSFSKKFGKLDREFVSEATGTWDDEGYRYGGWAHSAVC